MRERQRQQNRRRAHLGGHREAYEDSGPQGVAQAASPDDLHHEVEARGCEQRLKGLGGEEVAQLNVEHGHRYQPGGQQSDAPVEQQQPQLVHHCHCRGVRQRRQDAAHAAQLDDVEVGEGRDRQLQRLQRVDGERTVGEPPRIQRTLVRVEQDAKVAQRRQAEIVGVGQNGALVRVVEAAAIPVDAVEAEDEGDRQHERKRQPLGPRQEPAPRLPSATRAQFPSVSAIARRHDRSSPTAPLGIVLATAPWPRGMRTGPTFGKSNPTRCRTSPLPSPCCRQGTW